MTDLSVPNQRLNDIAQGLNGILNALSGGLVAALYPTGATPLVANSGNVAAAIATATLTGAVGQTTYIEGFDITSSGSTTAAAVTATVSDGVLNGLLFGYTYGTVAGVLVANAVLSIRFPRAIPASAQNTSIVISMPSLGAGNTHAIIAAYGFRV